MGESGRGRLLDRPRLVLALVGACLLWGLVAPAAGAGAQQPPPPEVPADQYRETADEVLARQEFQRPDPTVLERVRDWVGDRLDSLVRGLTGGGAGSLVGWIVLVLGAAALIWSLTRLGRSVRGDPTAPAVVQIDQGRTPDEWRAEADRLEGEEAWKEALLFRYRALLGDLVRSGVIDDVPGRTSGEYRREIESARPAAASACREATALFELAWYADRPTGRDESSRFRVAASAIVQACAEPPLPPLPEGHGAPVGAR